MDVCAPKQSGAGKIQIHVDGQTKATADLSTTGARQAQQLVSQITGLAAGVHTIDIVDLGPRQVAVDAIVPH